MGGRSGEKLGLVGRNGCGKSTLFKLILGEESPDSGTITFPRGYTIGHLAQHLHFSKGTVLEEACLGLADPSEEYKAEIILSGLGFSQEQMIEDPLSFSGGYQIRINLAKLLLSDPNLLLLDEPTNYLDIVSIRWLTRFLREWKKELAIISHDRLFTDAVTTHTMYIHRGGIRKMAGDTTKLYAQVALDEEIYEKTRINEDKKRAQLEEFITRFRAQASKATLVQSKVKALERMGRKEELAFEPVLDFQFSQSPIEGKTITEVNTISFAYPATDREQPLLIEDLSFTIGRTDRIAIIGKNGRGKSTLLRLLAGDLKPTRGAISFRPHAKIGYFGQTNIARLSPEKTIEEEISDANVSHSRTKVRAICGTMMFSDDDALKKIKVLSGGEKSRVLLGCILARPTNLLLLDEPTNHLDMESIQALLESLKSYNGAVVIVTHSELILRDLATRLIVFGEGKPRLVDHDYGYFLEKGGWGDEEEMSALPTTPTPKKSVEVKSVQAPPPSHHVQTLERRMRSLEGEMSTLQAQLASAPSTEAGSLQLRIKQLQKKIDALMKELIGV